MWFLCTCMWSSSVTGSEVLVDLSDVRFFLVISRGLDRDKSMNRINISSRSMEEQQNYDTAFVLNMSHLFLELTCLRYQGRSRHTGAGSGQRSSRNKVLLVSWALLRSCSRDKLSPSGSRTMIHSAAPPQPGVP